RAGAGRRGRRRPHVDGRRPRAARPPRPPGPAGPRYRTAGLHPSITACQPPGGPDVRSIAILILDDIEVLDLGARRMAYRWDEHEPPERASRRDGPAHADRGVRTSRHILA